jgi:glucose/arabinose dehydrogenase
MTRTTLRAERLEDRLTPVTLPPGFTESVFATGLTGPSAFAVAPDGRLFVAEQTGALRVVQNQTVLAAPFVSLAVDSQGERGLVGVALDPNFAANGFVYVYYTVPGSGGGAAHNRVSRFTANGNVAAGGETVLLDLDPLTAATNHNGGGLAFGADGKLYVAVGDNATPANSQTLANRLGKILRINPDGSIPADNPAAIDGLGAVPAGPTRAIWAAGLRNPFTIAFQPGTNSLFINDVGQASFEEVNAGRAGANYGWPATEGDFDPAAFPAFTRPLVAYARGLGSTAVGRSVIGGAAYSPAAFNFPAEFAGDYFYTDLLGGWINRRDAATGQVSNFADGLTGQVVVGLTLGPAGQLLYLTRGPGTGSVYQIAFTGAGTAPVAAGAGAGGGPAAKLMDPVTGATTLSVTAYPGFGGGVRVASADVTGDGTPDLVTGAGPGGGPHVKVFDGVTGAPAREVFAFEPAFAGGVFVAAADVDSDGFDDLIVSPDVGGGPRVKVVSGQTGAVLADFFAIDDVNFRGGVRVAAGDVSGDGVADLVVSAGAGGGPRVAVFDGTTLRAGVAPRKLMNDFFAFEPALRDGAFVAVGDVDADDRADIVAGAGPGGAPRVLVFGGGQLPASGPAGSILASFFAGDATGRGGVPVAARDVDGDGRAEVLAGTVAGSQPLVTPYLIAGGTATPRTGFLAFDATFTGGVFVG